MKCCSCLTLTILTKIAYGFLTIYILIGTVLWINRTGRSWKLRILCGCSSIYVWTTLSCKCITGPIFLQETVNFFRFIILHESVTILQALDKYPETVWFVQVREWPHRTSEVFILLEEYFHDCVDALDYHNETGQCKDWSPCSPDLKPCLFVRPLEGFTENILPRFLGVDHLWWMWNCSNEDFGECRR